MLQVFVLSTRDCNLEFTGHMFVFPTNHDVPSLIAKTSHDQDGQHSKKEKAGKGTKKTQRRYTHDYVMNDTKFSLLLIED